MCVEVDGCKREGVSCQQVQGKDVAGSGKGAEERMEKYLAGLE